MNQFEAHNPSKAEPGKLYELTIPSWEIEQPSFAVFDAKGNSTDRQWKYEFPVICMVLEQKENTTIVLNGENIVQIGHSQWERSLQGYDVLLVPANAVADKHTK
jgi:hypothetical protein